jgi:hypothetical protein
MCLPDLTPWPPSLRGKGENLAGLYPLRLGEGQNGGPGGLPPGRGLWGVSPHKTLKGDGCPPLPTRPRVGPKTLANPQPTGVGKGGPGGQSPQARKAPFDWERLRCIIVKKQTRGLGWTHSRKG